MYRRAVITGSTKGIGLAITNKLAAEGYDLFLNARTDTDLKAQCALLKDKYPEQGFYFSARDLSHKDQVYALSDDIKDTWQVFEVLINNAGVFRPGNLMEEDDYQLELQVNTNLYSAYYLTRKLIEPLKKAQFAHIINMCSVASIMAYPGGGSYCISKFALLGFSKVLRKELQETKIKVTAILPGATWSESWAGADFPEDRLMNPDDIALSVHHALNLGPSATIEEIIIRPQKGDV
jgi:short-subunit dehydrogenase